MWRWTSGGYFFWTVAANDQDPPPRHSSAQVEEQADGTDVCPLQIVQRQQQGPIARQSPRHAGVLLKQGALVQIGVVRDGRLVLY